MALRGNVDTRVRKALSGELDAVVLSAAGLGRLGLDGHITQRFEPTTEIIPACGQGTVVAEYKSARGDVADILRLAEDADTRIASSIERMTLKILGGGCLEPLGIYAKRQGVDFKLYIFREGKTLVFDCAQDIDIVALSKLLTKSSV